MGSTSHSCSRGCLVWLGRAAVFVGGLMLLGAIYESMAEASDARVYPPPGKLVDVGGYRLHINCTGTGAPISIRSRRSRSDRLDEPRTIQAIFHEHTL